MTFRTLLLEQGRATEWLTSVVMLTFAVALMFPGDTLATPGYRTFVLIGATEVLVAVPMAAVAVLRMAGLYINGRWRRSPLVRMVGAVIGCSVFAMLGAAFGGPYLTGAPSLSTGATTYFVLAGFDALAAYRSGADVRLAHSAANR